MLGSIVHQKNQNRALDTSDPTVVVDITEPDTKATGAELQYLFRSPRFNVIGGAGHYKVDRKQQTAVDVPGLFTTVAADDGSIRHTNAYLYAYLNNLVKNVTLTLGVSYDNFKSEDPTTTTLTDQTAPLNLFGGDSVSSTPASLTKNLLNPKIGVTWNPLPGTTVRAASFRVLKRPLISNQTLEPTQVAGFNQFYDDIEATESRQRFGIAVDQEILPDVVRRSGVFAAGLAGSDPDLRCRNRHYADPAERVARTTAPTLSFLDTAQLGGAQRGISIRALRADCR